MIKKTAIVFTIALSLLVFCVPMGTYAVDVYSSPDFYFNESDSKYYINVPDFADKSPSDVPIGKTLPSDDINFFILKQNTTYYIIMYYGSTAVVDPSSKKITVLNTSNGGNYAYKYKSMTQSMTDWYATGWSSQQLPQSIYYNNDNDFYYTTCNLYDSDGNQVFPLTPWAVAVRELKAETVPRVLGEMKIVTLCGVGCLVLLISLVVFFRVFRKFQVK